MKLFITIMLKRDQDESFAQKSWRKRNTEIKKNLNKEVWKKQGHENLEVSQKQQKLKKT